MSPTANPYPLISLASNSLSLSGEWRFSIDEDKVGEGQEWFAPGFNDSTWATVSVPHTWNVMPEFSEYEGLAWYRRMFTVPAEAKDAHLRLRFEAVFYLARIWLNGEYLGQHEGGYTPFEFDVSAVARPGEPNVLAVQVDNLRAANRIPAVLRPDWSFDWWNYGGITRDVSLLITSRAYIASQQIASTPHLIGEDEADSATVTARITVNNTSGDSLTGTLVANLLEDASGKAVLDVPVSSSISVASGGSADVRLTATFASPKLWHFDHPNLYRWSTSLKAADGQLLHMDEVTIGIRSIELKNGFFYLNGERVRLAGITRHEDYPGQGSAETVTAMAADYNDLKLLNEVLSRPVHYPQNEFILDYADRHGILLIPEVPAWQLTQQQMNSQQMRDLEKLQISEMIIEGFNHPSVWAWSIGNEIESDTSAGTAFVGEMVTYVKSLDPTRPVGFASNRLGSKTYFEATTFSDFVLMNQYFGTWAGPKLGLGPALDRIHQTWPDKVVIISEFGFEPHWNSYWGPPTSTLNTDQYYFIPDGTPSDSETADVIRRQLITEQMAFFRSKPFVSGAIFWTYQDYRTRSNFIMGLVDYDRNRRGSWEVLRDEYSPALIDSLILSPAADGQRTATVTVHTRGPVEVEMPAYTLRGYTLHWAVTSSDSSKKFSEGDVSLPTLAPAAKWSGDMPLTIPAADYIVTVSIIRPTGFPVTERSFDAQGEPIP
ncbi:MAG TPA: glycoside hydrolase family 2 TIM barrel-domain containing protein [Anaerolineaceae bacterium]